MEKTFSILTLGCKVNQYESEAMSELFESRGYRQVENDDFSDVYIVNTCTVTNLSDRKSRQFIRKSKKNNPNSVVAVVGCYSQVSPEEVKSIEGVDVVVGTTERNRIVDLIEESKKNNEKINIVKDLKNVREFANTTNFDSNNRTRAYMKVQDGCNRFCTYCIIPFARGPIRSRTIEDSVREARTLADRGFKEIVLTGIHIGSFGMDLGDMRLIDLIEAIAEVDGIERIRLSSVEPLIITDDFMERAVKTGKLCDHFHLSLQSGSNNILKAMNRRYTREDYIEKANIIRKYMPHAGLTTDIIVGFPGESQEDFEDSMNIVKEVGFGMSRDVARRLYSVGVRHIDVSGFGGTNFMEVENLRRPENDLSELYSWGIPTALSLLSIKNLNLKDLSLISSGGIKNSMDLVKSLVLGADMAAMSGEILSYLIHGGYEYTMEYLENIMYKAKIIMLLTGSKNVEELKKLPFTISGTLKELSK